MVLLVACLGAAQPLPSVGPYRLATHSHNDYRQARPLLDALANGMASIEADVFYVQQPLRDAEGRDRSLGRLFVAHDWQELEGDVPGFPATKGTLAALYLDPLWGLYQATGTVYPGRSLLLHVDMKTATEPTWRLLQNTLRNYPGLFTTYALDGKKVTPGPVTVYTNAEPSDAVLWSYGVLSSTVDGRFGDPFDAASWTSDAYTERSWRLPVVSSGLRSYIDLGRMFYLLAPVDDLVADYAADFPRLTRRTLLAELPRDAWALATRLVEDGRLEPSTYLEDHLAEAERLGAANGSLMRFWDAPDAPWFWDLAAGKPHLMIATDKPAALAAYLDAHPELGRTP